MKEEDLIEAATGSGLGGAAQQTREVCRYTKRQILSVAAHIFDPLGLCAVLMYVQKCWHLNYGWDEPVPEQIHNAFEEVVAELPQLEA